MTVQTFRKRPVEVCAIQWTGENEHELREWTGGQFSADPVGERAEGQIDAEVYDVLHATWVGLTVGQWVIKGVKGEFYPIAQDVLAETYEPVGDPS